MFVIVLDLNTDILYYSSHGDDEAVHWVTALDYIKTERLVFWYSFVIADDDAETFVHVGSIGKLLEIISGILLEEEGSVGTVGESVV